MYFYGMFSCPKMCKMVKGTSMNSPLEQGKFDESRVSLCSGLRYLQGNRVCISFGFNGHKVYNTYNSSREAGSAKNAIKCKDQVCEVGINHYLKNVKYVKRDNLSSSVKYVRRDNLSSRVSSM